MPIDENTKNKLLRVLSKIEASLPAAKKRVEEGNLGEPYDGLFNAHFVQSSGEVVLDSIEMTTKTAKFYFLHDENEETPSKATAKKSPAI